MERESIIELPSGQDDHSLGVNVAGYRLDFPNFCMSRSITFSTSD